MSAPVVLPCPRFSADRIIRCSAECPHPRADGSCACGGVVAYDENNTTTIRDMIDEADRVEREMIARYNECTSSMSPEEFRAWRLALVRESFAIRYNIRNIGDRERRARCAWLLRVASAPRLEFGVEFSYGTPRLRVTFAGHSRLRTLSDDAAASILLRQPTSGEHLVLCSRMCPNRANFLSLTCTCGGTADTRAPILYTAKEMAIRAAALMANIEDRHTRFLLTDELVFLLANPFDMPHREMECRARWLLEALALITAGQAKVNYEANSDVVYLRVGHVLRRKIGYRELLGISYTRLEFLRASTNKTEY